MVLQVSSPGMGADMTLGERLGIGPRGGARPSSSKDACLDLSGELDVEMLRCKVGSRSEWSLREEILSGAMSALDCESLRKGDGERSCRAPK